jgi:hypothetical protein
LSFHSDEHSLHNFFSQCGTVVSTRIAKGEDGRVNNKKLIKNKYKINKKINK